MQEDMKRGGLRFGVEQLEEEIVEEGVGVGGGLEERVEGGLGVGEEELEERVEMDGRGAAGLERVEIGEQVLSVGEDGLDEADHLLGEGPVVAQQVQGRAEQVRLLLQPRLHLRAVSSLHSLLR